MLSLLLVIALFLLLWRVLPSVNGGEESKLKPMPVCVGDPEAPNVVFIALHHEFKSWVSVGPDECSVFVLVETEEGFFHPEDVAEARRLLMLNPEIRFVKFIRDGCKLRGLTLLEIEANVGVA